MPPKIEEYTAPDIKLTPSPVGTAAFETAARRIGPLYSQVAEAAKAVGRIREEQRKELLWPLDIIRLYQQQADEATGKGVNFRVRSPNDRAHGQISRGAGGLGRALSGGGYAVAEPDRGPGTEEDVGDSVGYTGRTLSGGYLVPTETDATKGLDAYNRGVLTDPYTTQLVNTQDYWTKYYGGSPAASTTRGFEGQFDQYGNPTSALGPPPPVPGSEPSFFSGFGAATASTSFGGF